MGFSDDGHYVSSAYVMNLAAQYVSAFDKPLICHDIDEEMNHEGFMHEGAVSARLGVPGIPSIAEDICVARDAAIAEYTGATSTLPTLPARAPWTLSGRPRPEG